MRSTKTSRVKTSCLTCCPHLRCIRVFRTDRRTHQWDQVLTISVTQVNHPVLIPPLTIPLVMPPGWCNHHLNLLALRLQRLEIRCLLTRLSPPAWNIMVLCHLRITFWTTLTSYQRCRFIQVLLWTSTLPKMFRCLMRSPRMKACSKNTPLVMVFMAMS